VEQPNFRFPLTFQDESRNHPPRQRQKKARKSRLMRRILPSVQTASESHPMRQRDQASWRNGTGSQRWWTLIMGRSCVATCSRCRARKDNT